jgi:thioredoxin reductase (NADPH)
VTEHSEHAETVDRPTPVLVVVDSDEQARLATEGALARRFEPDYRVASADSAATGLAVLDRLAAHGDDVALVAADHRLPGMAGVEFLERAHQLHPSASRVLLLQMDQYHTRIPLTQLATLQQATALGRIDFWLVKGWVTPEEWLYPQVQEALSAWTIAHRPHHVVYRIVGEQWEPRSHNFRDLLTRNSVPFLFHPTDSAVGQQLLREYNIDTSRLPAVIRHDGTVLQDPSLADVAGSHGIQVVLPAEAQDVLILGAGPAGLSAAVYSASEGLRTTVVEELAIGGQAGTSSLIRNYLGFPRGLGGGDLAQRAWQQALLFGGQFVFTHRVSGLTLSGDQRVVRLDDGSEAAARAVIIATGVTYRRLGIPDLDRLVGTGVFYGAAAAEAPAMAGQAVYVIGGANSAGQAALHLARFASRVTLLVRGQSLAAGMSDYLVTQVEATANVDVRLGTRVVDGRGQSHLEGLTLEDLHTGRREEVSAAAVFVLIGAEPHTDWLREMVSLDERGFVLTGRDIPTSAWNTARPPLPFETSVPGVFAAGDVRYGSVKRVAGAVGEGSVTVGSVHRYLAETAAGPVEG